jgi:hypothetical protein
VSYLARIASRVASPGGASADTSRATPGGRSGSPLALRDQRLHLPHVAGQGLSGVLAPQPLLDNDELGSEFEVLAETPDTVGAEASHVPHSARTPFAPHSAGELRAPVAAPERSPLTAHRSDARQVPEAAAHAPSPAGRHAAMSTPLPHTSPVAVAPAGVGAAVQAVTPSMPEATPPLAREAGDAFRPASPRPARASFEESRAPLASPPVARSRERGAVHAPTSRAAEAGSSPARVSEPETESPTQALANALARVDAWIGRASAVDATRNTRVEASANAPASDPRDDWGAALSSIPFAEAGAPSDARTEPQVPRFSIGQIEVQVVTETRPAARAPKAPERRAARPAVASFRGLHPSKLTFGIRQR